MTTPITGKLYKIIKECKFYDLDTDKMVNLDIGEALVLIKIIPNEKVSLQTKRGIKVFTKQQYLYKQSILYHYISNELFNELLILLE